MEEGLLYPSGQHSWFAIHRSPHVHERLETYQRRSIIPPRRTEALSEATRSRAAERQQDRTQLFSARSVGYLAEGQGGADSQVHTWAQAMIRAQLSIVEYQPEAVGYRLRYRSERRYTSRPAGELAPYRYTRSPLKREVEQDLAGERSVELIRGQSLRCVCSGGTKGIWRMLLCRS